MKLGDDLFRGFARTAKLDVWSRPRSRFRFRQHESEDSYLHATKLAHDVRFGAAENLARRGIDDVCRSPAKLRLLDALFQHVWSKIKLMVAERGVVKTDHVPRFDHLLALVSYRLDRRRDGVARHQQQRVWIFLLDRFPECQHTAETTARALIDWRKLVNVVDLQQRHLNVALGFFLRGDRKDRGNEKDQGQRGTSSVHQTRVHVGFTFRIVPVIRA